MRLHAPEPAMLEAPAALVTPAMVEAVAVAVAVAAAAAAALIASAQTERGAPAMTVRASSGGDKSEAGPSSPPAEGAPPVPRTSSTGSNTRCVPYERRAAHEPLALARSIGGACSWPQAVASSSFSNACAATVVNERDTESSSSTDTLASANASNTRSRGALIGRTMRSDSMMPLSELRATSSSFAAPTPSSTARRIAVAPRAEGAGSSRSVYASSTEPRASTRCAASPGPHKAPTSQCETIVGEVQGTCADIDTLLEPRQRFRIWLVFCNKYVVTGIFRQICAAIDRYRGLLA